MRQILITVVIMLLIGCQTTGGVRANGNGDDVNTNVRGGISIPF